MADLRDKVRPGILLEMPLDERGLFAPVTARSLAGRTLPATADPSRRSAPTGLLLARRLTLLAGVATRLGRSAAVGVRLALCHRMGARHRVPVRAGADGRRRAQLFRRRPRALSRDRRSLGHRSGGADVPGAVAAHPASGVCRTARVSRSACFSPSSRRCGPAPRCWAARSRPGSPAASPSSSTRPMAASA